jgi:uncharacterized protein HemX
MSQNYVKSTVHEISQNGQKTAQSLPKNAQGSFWDFLIPRWEKLIVEGREVKGFVVSPAMAAVVLAFALGLAATIYWRLSDQMSSQHDLIIELRTSLRDHTDAETEYRRETKETIATQKVYFDSLSNQVYALKGILTPEQSRRLEAATRRN